MTREPAWTVDLRAALRRIERLEGDNIRLESRVNALEAELAAVMNRIEEEDGAPA